MKIYWMIEKVKLNSEVFRQLSHQMFFISDTKQSHVVWADVKLTAKQNCYVSNLAARGDETKNHYSKLEITKK